MKIVRNIILGKFRTKFLLLIFLFIGIGTNLMLAQNSNFIEYTGEVLDSNNKKPLIFATLTIEYTNHSTITNSEGQFALKVPNDVKNGNLIIAFLGYKTMSVPLAQLEKDGNKILMDEFVMALSEARIDAPNDAKTLVIETLNRKGENYLNENTVMTAFYRETIKKRRTNVSLSEAVVNIYSLNITDRRLASQMFVRKKPRNAEVWPTEVSYRVDYREKNGKWYYGYSNVLLEFKINWDKRLFNSVYSLSCEMAVTDWEQNVDNIIPKSKNRIKSSIILGDEAIGFADPNFWGEYNIIEPEKSIESAIKKIQRQLRRGKFDTDGTSEP